jgi:hypothetical protein
MFRTSLLTICSTALAIALWAVPGQAFALTITPIRYEIAGNPGDVLTKTMGLVNETKDTQIFYASFANFEAQGDTGSPSFVEAKDDLGTWITTEQASVTLAPGAQKEIPFKITIPKDAEPGGHFATIFWGTSPGSRPGEVSVGTKTGILILLSVNGDVKESAGLVDFQTHNKQWFYKKLPVGFQYRFSNQGGDRVKPTGSVIIRSILGWKVKAVNANQFDGNVLPGTTRKFLPEWVKTDSVDVRDQEIARHEKYSFTREVKSEWHNFAVGIFRAKLDVNFGATAVNVKSNSIYFIVFPWELLLVAIVFGVPLYLILRTIIRRYNRAIIKKAQAQFTQR